jgi:hypothetical protein
MGVRVLDDFVLEPGRSRFPVCPGESVAFRVRITPASTRDGILDMADKLRDKNIRGG